MRSCRTAGKQKPPSEDHTSEKSRISQVVSLASKVWRPAGGKRSHSTIHSEAVPMASPQTLLLCLLLLVVTEGRSRQAAIPGCHLHPFNVTVRSNHQGTCQGSHVAQACVGHCESSAFPSRYSVLVASGYRHNITSVSQCCTISGLRKEKVQLHCRGNRKEELEIFTARACQCDMCRLSRY
ncbi:glycoprotein hormone alpha-2 [Moschus berezovskii]|uniref:glycoprotein hormone alpha-2 n=1 Tax=Moschus berezovskii TaxID=68408 RepID=UPI00244488DE|nr:glycoprotein hormone alpha-2 [Moschus berezovskii]